MRFEVPIGVAKEGTWEEEDKSDGTFLLVIEAGGVD